MENNRENAIRFFATHLNSEVKVNAALFHANDNSRNSDGKTIMSASILADIHEGTFSHRDFTLLLKDIKKVSEDVLKDVAILWDGVMHKTAEDGFYVLKTVEGIEGRLPAEITDYLRFKKIAVPFGKLSVEKQIEYNWIKLIN